MTKDELASLTQSAIRSDNTLRAIGTSQFGGPAALMAEPITRLLEERERLLEALREAHRTVGVDMFPAYGGRLSDLYGKDVATEKSEIISASLRRFKDALDFAEAPAK